MARTSRCVALTVRPLQRPGSVLYDKTAGGVRRPELNHQSRTSGSWLSGFHRLVILTPAPARTENAAAR